MEQTDLGRSGLVVSERCPATMTTRSAPRSGSPWDFAHDAGRPSRGGWGLA